MAETRLKLFVHELTLRHYDYGDLLDTEYGIAWSMDGDVLNVFGLERGVTLDDIRARLAEFSDRVELVVGPPVERKHDMNPHGLI